MSNDRSMELVLKSIVLSATVFCTKNLKIKWENMKVEKNLIAFFFQKKKIENVLKLYWFYDQKRTENWIECQHFWLTKMQNFVANWTVG